MKIYQRLEYNRLAEALGERGLVEPEALQAILQQCLSDNGLFPEFLVKEGQISDWEISRVVCELFGLPFLPVEVYAPSPTALEGLDSDFLNKHALVPMDRFGKLLTVAMPGLTPSQILGALSREADAEIVPIVGSVDSNRRWLHHQFPEYYKGAAMPAPVLNSAPVDVVGQLSHLDAALPSEGLDLSELSDDWGDLFDQGDAAVLLELEGKGSSEQESVDLPDLPSLDGLGD